MTEQKQSMSGRKYMTYVFSTTYCGAIAGSIILVIMGKMTVETFLALLAGFTSITVLIAEWYFLREDRKKENGGETK